VQSNVIKTESDFIKVNSAVLDLLYSGGWMDKIKLLVYFYRYSL
jgi:hypothetical protein